MLLNISYIITFSHFQNDTFFNKMNLEKYRSYFKEKRITKTQNSKI